MTTKLIVVFPKYCTIQLKHHYWEDLPFIFHFSIFSLMLKLLQMNFNSSWYPNIIFHFLVLNFK